MEFLTGSTRAGAVLTVPAVAFIPDTLLYDGFYRFGAVSAVVATIYPIGLAAVGVRLFSRRSLTDRQLLAVVTGVLRLPRSTAISIHDTPSGDWAAAGVYLAAFVVSLRRIRTRRTSPVAPIVAPPAAGRPAAIP